MILVRRLAWGCRIKGCALMSGKVLLRVPKKGVLEPGRRKPGVRFRETGAHHRGWARSQRRGTNLRTARSSRLSSGGFIYNGVRRVGGGPT